MSFNLLVWIWVALVVTVLALAIYRNLAGIHGDEHFHILGAEVKKETITLRRIEAIERWGQLLTVLAVIYGLVLAGTYLYETYLSGRVPPR